MPQATTTTAMYSSDGAQYFQPVTQLSAQQKSTRTDRLEVCFFPPLTDHDHQYRLFFFFTPVLSAVLREFLVSEVHQCVYSASRCAKPSMYL